MDFGECSNVPTISADESARLLEHYGPLAQSVRDLIDATIRTQADGDTVEEVTAQLRQLTERLRAGTLSDSPGMRYVVDGRPLAWGNAVIGLRNPIAPPLVIQHGENGHCWADFHLGAAYEGPPSLVHGGVSALVLDHLLGEAASDGLTKALFTGTITVKYLRGTPPGAVARRSVDLPHRRRQNICSRTYLGCFGGNRGGRRGLHHAGLGPRRGAVTD